MKINFKLSQTIGKSPFPGWNQLFNSLKSWSRDDRYAEYLEIHGFPQNALFSRISKDFQGCSEILQKSRFQIDAGMFLPVGGGMSARARRRRPRDQKHVRDVGKVVLNVALAYKTFG